ncbi:tyrosine-type recombinase/integrase [Neobacillus sp. NPDC093127]|uniref:tyrosine-type recombinase/integrase n=1 Tax=Neobacillus sp. NPDC093127 TaxID=3364296 RepID=UPI0037FEFF91
MKVEPIKTANGERYVLVDDSGELVRPVMKYLKYRDNTGSARNTLRRHCYNLKLLFEFLSQKKIDFDQDFSSITIDTIAEFVAWLKKPMGEEHVKVTSIQFSDEEDDKNYRCARTINFIIGTVVQLFEYLGRFDEYANNMNKKLTRELTFKGNNFKPFLHHLSSKHTKKYTTNILKQKVPKDTIKTLTKEEVKILLDSCKNTRDQLLLYILYETGIRISEALALQISDIEIGRKLLHVVDRGELENKAEIKTIGSERSINISQDIINLFSKYLIEIIDQNDVDTDFLFIKLKGPNVFQPMEYHTADGMFESLEKRTGIKVHAHMYRHTHITEMVRLGMRQEVIQKRAGHKNFQTTSKYVGLTEEDLREEYNRIKNKSEDDHTG